MAVVRLWPRSIRLLLELTVLNPREATSRIPFLATSPQHSRRRLHGGFDGRLLDQRYDDQIRLGIDEHGRGHADPRAFRDRPHRTARLVARRACQSAPGPAPDGRASR